MPCDTPPWFSIPFLPATAWKPLWLQAVSAATKKDTLNHKWKITFRVYFFLLARVKAGAKAQQELFDTAMEDTSITALKYPVHREQNSCGLGRRGSPSGCRHGATRQGCTRERGAKPASGSVPTEGTKHLWERGHLLSLPQHSSHHSGVTAEAGHSAEPVLQPGRELRVLGHPVTVTMCPLRGGGQAQPPQWSTWEAHPRRSHLESRAMFYVPLQHHSAHFCTCSQYYPPSKNLLMPIPKGTLIFSGGELQMPTLHQIFSALSKMSHGQLPAPACSVNIRKLPGIKIKARLRSVCAVTMQAQDTFNFNSLFLQFQH